jgi:phage gp29-like protein
MKLLSTGLTDKMLSTHNPLRGLTMSRVVAELEAGQRGDLSNLQWLYHFIEKRDATLRGAKRRILSSLGKLDWDIKIQSDLSAADQAKAEKQAEELKARYRKMKGFRRALKHQALAEFRGYCHIEKHFDRDGEIIALEPVPQWHWCKDGYYGDWLFQADALRGGVAGVPITTGNFIIREVEDPINEIALIAFTRKGLSSKDFDAYVARYGIPFVFWILSDVMAQALAAEPNKLTEWMQVMRGIGSDGEGIIPGGTIETLDNSAGGKDNNVFLQHLGYQDEQIVMAATSGKLTMLNDATGIGGGASDAHQDTFDEIALALAMEISESLHEQLDVPILAKLFPGQEPLVYFELAAKDSEDVGKLVSNVKSLSDAGWEMDGAELSEKTGYTLTRKEAATADPQDPNTPTTNNTETKQKEGAAGADPAAPVKDMEPKKPAGAKNRDKKTPKVSGLAETEATKKAAAALLAGFGDLATLFLAKDESELAPLLADAVLDEERDETSLLPIES